MILQALTQYYEDLLRLGKIDRPGWTKTKVSWGLLLNSQGQPVQLLRLQQENTRGKKTVLGPQEISMPSPVKRSVGVAANFLCDNSGYLLGIDSKGKPERTASCFAAAKALHLKLLETADSPAARAVTAFFTHWDPSKAAEHPVLQPDLEELLKGGNLVFWYENSPVSHDPAVADAILGMGLPAFANVPLISGYTLENLPVVLYVSAGVAGIGFCAYFMAMEYQPASIVSLVYFFKPALSPVLAWALHGEEIPFNMLMGIILIVAGSFCAIVPGAIEAKKGIAFSRF